MSASLVALLITFSIAVLCREERHGCTVEPSPAGASLSQGQDRRWPAAWANLLRLTGLDEKEVLKCEQTELSKGRRR